jgi:hypothetical protein
MLLAHAVTLVERYLGNQQYSRDYKITLLIANKIK